MAKDKGRQPKTGEGKAGEGKAEDGKGKGPDGRAAGQRLDPIGQALTLAARRHRARTAVLLADLGLFPGQDRVLQSLAATESLSMSAIAAELSVRPPTASKMIARMAAQGLVERQGRDGDARLVLVRITEEGRGRVDRMRRVAKRVEREALAGLDDKDARRLRRLLKRVARNLDGKLEGKEARLEEGVDGDLAVNGDAALPMDADLPPGSAEAQDEAVEQAGGEPPPEDRPPSQG